MEKKYTKEHEWIAIIDGNEANVGITEFAQSELGEIVFVDVQTLGEHLGAMEVFGSIEAVKTVADLHIPVAGEVIDFNERLDNEPELVNNDAECEGFPIVEK